VIGVAVVAAAAFLGIRSWRKRREHTRLVDRVASYGKALTDYERCLTGDTKNEFLTAIVFAYPAGFGQDDRAVNCAKDFDAKLETFGATVRALGVRAPAATASATTISRDRITAPFPTGSSLFEDLDLVCNFVFYAHRDVEVLFKAVGRTPPADVSCGAYRSADNKPPLLPTLGEYLSSGDVASMQVAIRPGSGAPSMRDVVAFLASSDLERSPTAIARSLDGKTWKGLDVPRDIVVAAPAPTGFVAIARGAR
jgi:hypothetical protein